jgi:hypothetical protein
VPKRSIVAFVPIVAALPFVVVLASGCEKSASSSGATASAEPSGTGTSIPIASSAPSAPAASSAPTRAAASDSAAPTAAVDAGKPKDGGTTVATKSAKAHVEGKNFALDLASPGCKVDADCAMTIRLVAGGDWHVNKDYPYKFIATAAPGVTFLGKGDANTFGKQSGDFHEEGEKSATLTVRFKPTSTGEAKVSGTYKLSVCSAEQCQIEQQAVTLAVPVM